jgi:hypothetical protein
VFSARFYSLQAIVVSAHGVRPQGRSRTAAEHAQEQMRLSDRSKCDFGQLSDLVAQNVPAVGKTEPVLEAAVYRRPGRARNSFVLSSFFGNVRAGGLQFLSIKQVSFSATSKLIFDQIFF